MAAVDDDPFAALGLSGTATPDEVRSARRRLAKTHHPDAGGDADRMRALNHAAAHALRLLAATPEAPEPDGWSGVTSDVSSFTVEALPPATFEALLVVTSWLGDVIDDEPPYRLDTHLREPVECWCRLELVPEAGGSTVSITVAGAERAARTPPPDIDSVRDVWVAALNRLDWTEIEGPLPS